ncbi:MAG: D-alanyl-D-alanine carboxypeptidase [Caulobacteraceae bacterium]|nr:D-alanyl-D-alanine carboxypeptidase [Caulobacteraceae bacterium]
MSFPVLRALRLAVALAAGLAVAAPASLALAQTPYLHVSTFEPKYTAIVMDARSGEVLYANRADSPRYPASITKIMTMYMAFEQLASGRLHENDLIVVSPHAAAQAPTKLGLRAGDTITVENALHAMAVISANDMAVAMAEKIGGTESRFAAMMTLKAQQLGMLNSQFVNANGLPDSRQISSARDIAILSRAVLRDFPQYYGYFSQEAFTYNGRTTRNHNGLLGRMPGVDGLKTGFTNAAGYNLAASAMRNGHRLIAVVMGGPSGAARNANVEGLLLTGFDIMERRDRGERILVTQNLFEPASPIYADARRSGDDSDPIDIVLTRGTARQGPMTVASSMADARAMQVADAAARSATHGRGDWWVEVGQFSSRRAAMSQIEQVSHQFAQLFDDAVGAVDGGGHAYRARFSGLSESAAKEACGAVKSRGIPCVAGGRA